MSFALNEVEAMAKRATRGAGYSWGLAEDAANATRWLCAQGQDGCAVLAGLLDAGFGPGLVDHVPGELDGHWRGHGVLCPLATGATLSDMASRVARGAMTLSDLAFPAMILPFAALVARQIGSNVTVTCGDATAVTDGRCLTLAGAFPDYAPVLTLRAGGTGRAGGVVSHQVTRATPVAAAWESLTRLAYLSYAPATDESRRLGAGTALTDND